MSNPIDVTELFIKHKNKIPNAAILLLALVVGWNLLQQQNSEIDSLNRQKVDEVRKNEVCEELEQYDRQLGEFSKFLAKPETSDLINSLSAMAMKCGVRINSIKPEEERKSGDCVKIPFVLHMTALDYQGIGNFISNLESDKNIYTVESVSFEKESSDTMLQEQEGESLRKAIKIAIQVNKVAILE
ncbi:MAG: type 4a pilus biogenesis protein PilO [Candidatus Omnitrophica bacterium]|nr:type 4a pilus biogenesis protein PilO [Candidatus Omnitrophota bacterium]